MSLLPRTVTMLLASLATSACAAGLTAASDTSAPPSRAIPTTQPPQVTSAPSGQEPVTAPAVSAPTVAAVEVAYRVERRTDDAATADFEEVVRATLSDAAGWQRAGFVLVESPDAPYAVVLAEPDETQALCLPYDVYRTYSCQNGPTVVLNAQRWRQGTPQWTGSLAAYKRMLVNHEFGHLLGQRHLPCVPALPAPVMCQQSTELDGAIPNPVPLPEEIARAARHDRPLAPGPGE